MRERLLGRSLSLRSKKVPKGVLFGTEYFSSYFCLVYHNIVMISIIFSFFLWIFTQKLPEPKSTHFETRGIYEESRKATV